MTIFGVHNGEFFRYPDGSYGESYGESLDQMEGRVNFGTKRKDV